MHTNTFCKYRKKLLASPRVHLVSCYSESCLIMPRMYPESLLDRTLVLPCPLCGTDISFWVCNFALTYHWFDHKINLDSRVMIAIDIVCKNSRIFS